MAFRKFAATFDDRALAYATGNAVQDLLEPPPDALTVFEDGPNHWRVEAYFDIDAGEHDLAASLAPLVDWPLPPFAIETVPDLNWVAISQAALPPVRAGRFTVHGSHDKGRVARGPGAILIDAGEAFGTAHHATTFGCLYAVDRLARTHAFYNMLDLGCGSGVLAIAAAKAMPKTRIVAVDMDPQSVNVAIGNARLNGAGNRIALYVGKGLDHPHVRARAPFDFIVANILAGPLIGLSPSISRAIIPGGILVLSGILVPQAAEVVATYLSHGFTLQRHDRIAGWSTLTFTRR